MRYITNTLFYTFLLPWHIFGDNQKTTYPNCTSSTLTSKRVHLRFCAESFSAYTSLPCLDRPRQAPSQAPCPDSHPTLCLCVSV